jgi:hypothetical protein
MGESDLTEMWEETLRRMRACFNFDETGETPQASQDRARGRTGRRRRNKRAAAETGLNAKLAKA